MGTALTTYICVQLQITALLCCGHDGYLVKLGILYMAPTIAENQMLLAHRLFIDYRSYFLNQKNANVR